MTEWIWVFTTISILFLPLLAFRLGYKKGYRSGAKYIVAEWKKTLETEGEDR